MGGEVIQTLTIEKCQWLLSQWLEAEIDDISIPAMGAANTLRALTTSRGKYVLRLRYNVDRSEQSWQDELVRWLDGRGIPVVLPLLSRSGSFHFSTEGFVASLFPFIADRQIQKRDLAEADIASMGCFLGRLHQCLEGHDGASIPAPGMSFDSEATTVEIDRLLGLIDRSCNDPEDGYARNRLRTQRAWLSERSSDERMPDVGQLPGQVVHGDYQETNVFFRDGDVSAVIDWDGARWQARALEVARVLHFVCDFKADRSVPFVRGYRSTNSISAEELDMGVEWYRLLRAHDVNMFRMIYDERRNRLRRFLNPRPFSPVAENWSSLRSELDRC